MGTVTFGVSSPEETSERIAAATGGGTEGARIDFPSAERMFTVMLPARWELVRRMAGAGALTVEELASRLGRDADDVYADVRALLGCGVLFSTEDRRIIFPFKAVHIDVTLEAAA